MTGRPPNGFALPVVLWALVILGGLAAGHLDSARSDLRTGAVRERVAMARAAADAGVRIALLALDRAIARTTPVPDRIACKFGRARLAIALTDEAGKIDLNRSDPALLAALFRQLDIPDPAGLADRIADFRDPDDLVRLSGAEAADYRRLGLPSPRNGPLLSLDDLVALPGGSRTLPKDLRPHATVHGAGRPDISLASPAVVAAMGAIAARPQRTPSRQRTFTIRAAAEHAQGGAFQRLAVVRLGRPVLTDPEVLEWRRGTVAGTGGNPATPQSPTGPTPTCAAWLANATDGENEPLARRQNP